MNIQKKIITIMLLIFISKYIYSKTTLLMNNISLLFSAIKNNNLKLLKTCVSKDIKFKYLTTKEILKLGEKLLMEEITNLEYIKLITGNNILKFLERKFQLIEYKITSKVEVEQNITEKDIPENKLYYIKVRIKYKNQNKEIITKEVELDYIKVKDGTYKLVGFIL